MKTILLAVGTLCLMAGCSSKVASSKGIVSDATMNTVTIVTDKNDTLSFSTMDANKDEVNGLLLNDTLEVFYTGKYTPGMNMAVSVLPDMYGVKCKKTVSACLRKESARKRWTIAMLLPLLCLVLTLRNWNFSFPIISPMKYWRDVACLQEVMHGTWKMTIRKMYG